MGSRTESRCVLAFSGGLDTSAIVPWLLDRGYEVHALIVDVGQHADFEAIRRRALALGAASATVRNVVPALTRRMLPTAVGLAATYEGTYRLGTALTRPWIALEQVKLARALGCETLVHGATGKGNDQIRFEFAYRSLAPGCAIVAPWRLWEFSGRADLAAFLAARDVPFAYDVEKTFSLDENLWHLSIEGGPLEDPAAPLAVGPILDAFAPGFGDPDVAPAGDGPLTLRFAAGVPTALDGEPLSLEALVRTLNARYRRAPWAHDLVLENRFTGVKSRGIYLNPAAKLLHAAVDGLARTALNKPTYDLWCDLGRRYADLLYSGEYFSQQRLVVEAAAQAATAPLNGEVTLALAPAPHVAAVDAPAGLFRKETATFEASDWEHADAAGFIRLGWQGRVGPAPLAADGLDLLDDPGDTLELDAQELAHADALETHRRAASRV